MRAYRPPTVASCPEQLANVVETPVPANPATGKPFNYSLSNGVAKIADSTLGDHFEYTITIRK